MPQEIAMRNEFLNPSVWKQVEEVTARLQKSGALPSSITNGAQLSMVFLAGYEAGMRPMESLNAFYIVNGKLTIYGDALIRQLKRNGYRVKWVESTNEKATVRLTAPRPVQPVYVKNADGDIIEVSQEEPDTCDETYTIEDAKLAGLAGKGTWSKFPKDMLRWKAIGRAVRFFCPEVLGGVSHTKEEAEDIEVVETKPATFSEDKVVMTEEQYKRLYSLINGELKMPLEVANGWSMGQFQCPISELSVEQAPKAIAALEKRLEMETRMNAGKTQPEATQEAEEVQITASSIDTEGRTITPVTAEEVAAIEAEDAAKNK